MRNDIGHLLPTELSLWKESPAEHAEGGVERGGEEGGVETRTWFPGRKKNTGRLQQFRL